MLNIIFLKILVNILKRDYQKEIIELYLEVKILKKITVRII